MSALFIPIYGVGSCNLTEKVAYEFNPKLPVSNYDVFDRRHWRPVELEELEGFAWKW
jgi:hypothetical protein